MTQTSSHDWLAVWEDLHREMDLGRYPSENLVRFIAGNFNAVADRSKIRILEIGCGQGPQMWFMAREGFTVHGIDTSPSAIAKARRRLTDGNLHAELEVGNVLDLADDDNTFDAVIDIGTLMGNDWATARAMVAQAYRVLKPGGLLFSQTHSDSTFVGEGQEKIDHLTYSYTFWRDLHKAANTDTTTNRRLLRLTSEDQIVALYAPFREIEWEHVTRTTLQRKQLTGEWLITCRK